MLAAIGATIALGRLPARRPMDWSTRRVAYLTAASWLVPAAALVANLVPEAAFPGGRALHQALIRRCRFGEVPVDDLERLAIWCRDNTPKDARFIGPPGPKTFRLWSRRSLAFNRAGSPYHAAGLADWSSRFRDHVGFEGTNAELVRAYLHDRHGLERRYDRLSAAQKAALATRQGARYVIAAAPEQDPADTPLRRLHSEGRFAVYRVDRPVEVADSDKQNPIR